jgi:hypothetical protein
VYHETSPPTALGFAPRVIAPPQPVGPAPAAFSAGFMPAGVPSCPEQVESTFLMQARSQDVAAWPVERVLEWLTQVGLGHLCQNFEQHRITGDVLIELSPSDLDEIGLLAVGDKKRFLRASCELRGQPMPVSQACPPPPPTPPPYPSTDAFLSDLRPSPPPLDPYLSPFSSPMPATSFPAW